MSAVPPTNRPVVGRALIVGSSQSRVQPLAAMQALGYECAEADDPYAAAAELFRRPLVYRAVILSLTNLFREELALIGTIRRQLAHIDVWLTHAEGRPAALVEAIGLGTAGLLGEDGRLLPFPTVASQRATGSADASSAAATSTPPEREANSVTPTLHQREPSMAADDLLDDDDGGPMLTPEELKALLERPEDCK